MNRGPHRADVTASYTESWSSSQEKMEYLLSSRFAKTGSSTIYKLNRNFHYFSWHNCLYLATDKRDPVGAFRKPALAKGSSGREGDKVVTKGISPPVGTALLLLVHSPAPPQLRPHIYSLSMDIATNFLQTCL